MIIKKLTLHNFGVYAGTNSFEFNNNKPIVLIGGMNGRGKTTILEAILLALYGANSFAYAESKYNSYGQYLKSYINTNDASMQSFIELTFLNDNDNMDYTVRKWWNGNLKKIHEKIEVYQNGTINSFLTDNWAMFIESLLPSGLSNFFFFDGEKIAKLAEENTNEQMKDSIKNLLGIKVLDSLSKDLNKISSAASKKKAKFFNEQEVTKLKEIRDKAKDALDQLENEISITKKNIQKAEKNLEKEKNNYSSQGGDIIGQKQELYSKRSQFLAMKNAGIDHLLELTASALPLNLVKPLLLNIAKQANIERIDKDNKLALNKIESVYAQYIDQKSELHSTELIKFLNYFKKHVQHNNITPIYNLSDYSYMQLTELNSFKLNKLSESTIETKFFIESYQREIDNIESYLSVEIDEKALNKIYKKILLLERNLLELQIKLNELNKQQPILNSAYIRANSDFKQYVEKMLKSLELSDDEERIIKYSHYAKEILEEYMIKLQKRKIDILSTTMTECYKQLANKKGLIKEIVIDPITLSLNYLNETGLEIDKAKLSAGEKQLMVIALLWALAKCSKKKLPVIIDTPLSRLDSKHRMSVIKTYFPNASDQTIILSTDSEIYGKYYNAIMANVGNEFTLHYNDDTKSTTIKDGYFTEVAL